MLVRPGQHVSGDGRVYHPYLAQWAKYWDVSIACRARHRLVRLESLADSTTEVYTIRFSRSAARCLCKRASRAVEATTAPATCARATGPTAGPSTTCRISALDARHTRTCSFTGAFSWPTCPSPETAQAARAEPTDSSATPRSIRTASPTAATSTAATTPAVTEEQLWRPAELAARASTAAGHPTATG